MAEQVALLKAAEQQAVNAFVDSGCLPEPVGELFVEAVRQVLHRFEVHPVSLREVWDTLFPGAAPATPAELKQRLAALIDERVADTPEDRVRLVPREGDAS